MIKFELQDDSISAADFAQLLLNTIGKIMSEITAPLNQALTDLATAKAEGEKLKASNATLSADAVTKDAQITQLQADLAAAQAASGVDPADAALVTQVAQASSDLKQTLA